MRRISLLTSALLLSLAACTDPPTVSGTVTDIWGRPVEGATVRLEGAPEHTTTDGAGAFTLASLPQASTTGFAIRARVCGGDTSTWYPTMTLLPAEATAGLGPGDVLDGQVVWVVSTADARAVEQGMLENGAPSGLDEVGAIFGQIFDMGGSPLPLAAIRGPDATRVHYHQGDDIWLPYVNSTEDGEARFASPGAPWALWTCRAQAFNTPPVLAGASPGWITRWDFRATSDFTAGD